MGANSLSLFSFFLGLIFFGLGNALAVKVGNFSVCILGKFKYGPLPKIWMDHWYVECHMWIMSRSHFFTSRSKIYKCGYILNATYRSHYGLFLQSNILPNASDYLWINLLILFAGIAITGIGEGCTLRLGLVLDLAMDSCLLFPTKQVYLLAVLESL